MAQIGKQQALDQSYGFGIRCNVKVALSNSCNGLSCKVFLVYFIFTVYLLLLLLTLFLFASTTTG